MTLPDDSHAPDRRIAGSFRDPSGYVFSLDGRIFRAVDEDCHGVLRGLSDEGLLGTLIEQRAVVGTRFVEDEELRRTLAAEHPPFEHFLEHQVLSTITYPYEWSVSMLADAGVHTLDLQIRLLQSGCSLKDATAYNVQFVEGRPVFIDLSSIERPRRLDVWFALGQFSQMFTYPLLLTRYCGWDLRSYFLANLGGRGVEQVARGFGWLQRLRPRLLLDVTLPAWLTTWAEKRGHGRRAALEKPNQNTGAQILNLRRVRGKIARLAAGYKPSGVWSQYTDICNYDDEAEAAKKSAVREFLDSSRPRRVLDLGCNTGDYSRLAVEAGAEVLAADADHDAVEILYRRLREKPAPITPVVVDLCNPSPPIGYMNRERASFLDRVDADCVLALALLHHLLVSGNLSLEAVCELMHELTNRDLVLEFVPPDDDMFRRLMKFRVDLFGDLTLDACRDVFLRRFELLKETALPDSKRTLLFLRKPE
ncbi:MAG TPA: class I SAM-dependent methyltransferase [Thermoguttaceae bacterium]|nr:class I SAM-dependent methyltransferase [Thermoguttaceae bacterium]